jgi:uncharacterized protein
VVADTHSEPHERAHGLIAALRPHAILHAGDIGDLSILDGLAAIAPVFAVRGNIDERVSDVPDVLVCGHSHLPFIGIDRGIAVFNPGSIGPRRYPLPIVFGVIEVPPIGTVRMHHVSCESGARWMP